MVLQAAGVDATEDVDEGLDERRDADRIDRTDAGAVDGLVPKVLDVDDDFHDSETIGDDIHHVGDDRNGCDQSDGLENDTDDFHQVLDVFDDESNDGSQILAKDFHQVLHDGHVFVHVSENVASHIHHVLHVRHRFLHTDRVLHEVHSATDDHDVLLPLENSLKKALVFQGDFENVNETLHHHGIDVRELRYSTTDLYRSDDVPGGHLGTVDSTDDFHQVVGALHSATDDGRTRKEVLEKIEQLSQCFIAIDLSSSHSRQR